MGFFRYTALVGCTKNKCGMVCVMTSRMRLARHTSDTHQSDAERRPRLMIIIMKIKTFSIFQSSCFSHLVVLGEKDDKNWGAPDPLFV